ncbi:hypothetical protein VTJ83DRAFT_3190 [Remersonia thermophila]|uniref:Kinetochore protein mis14 n=1 Tax=Remersonia thermophila TaxID=72144 RepID=A0ABR4DDC3_9PEZI
MDAQTQRRIELQAPEDLTYLIDNVRKAAADSINAAFPPVDDQLGGQEDELRNRIEELVNDYILQTFTLAAPNLTINGLPVTNIASFLPPNFHTSSGAASHASAHPSQPEVRYEYEPFDPRKRDRIEQLISEEEDLLRSIAALKRRAPRATSSRWADESSAALADDDAGLAALERRLEEEGAAAGRRALEGMGALERQAEIEKRFVEAVEGLGRLKTEMPAARAKMERARGAAGYVMGEEEGK